MPTISTADFKNGLGLRIKDNVLLILKGTSPTAGFLGCWV